MGGQLSVQGNADKVLQFEHYRFLNAYRSSNAASIINWVNFTNLTEVERWYNSLKEHGQINRTFLLFPYYYQVVERQTCGSSGTIKIQYPAFYHLLSDEIKIRTGTGKRFQYKYLWYILFALVTGAGEFHQLREKVGDIRPYNVVVFEAGNIKLLSKLSMPNYRENYLKTVVDNYETFLAPEEIDDCTKKYGVNKNCPIKTEAFSIGMTMLAAGLLLNYSKVYNMERMEINWKKFSKLLYYWYTAYYEVEYTETVRGYSASLIDVVNKLLYVYSETRVTSLQVRKWIYPYQECIASMKSFEIEKIQTKKGVEDEMGLTLVEQKTMKVGKGVEEKPGSFIVLKSRKKISFNQGVQAHEVNHRVVDQKSKTVVTHYFHSIGGVNHIKTLTNSPQRPPSYSIGQGYRLSLPIMDVEKTAKMNVASHLDFRSNGLNTASMTSAFTNYSSQSFQMPLTGHYYPQQFTSSSQDSDLLRRIDYQLLRSKLAFPSK